MADINNEQEILQEVPEENLDQISGGGIHYHIEGMKDGTLELTPIWK